MVDSIKEWVESSLEDELENSQIFFSAEEIDSKILKLIPPGWMKMVSDSVGESEYAALKEIWSPIFSKIPMVTRQLSRVLKSIAILIDSQEIPSLLYIYADEEGDICCHKGRLPLIESDIPDNLKEIWNTLPSEFTDFYKIHNGWTVLDLGDMGLLPLQEMSLLSWEEWNLEPEVVKATPVDVDKTLIVFNSGGSGYMGFETAKTIKSEEDTKPLIWWSNKPTEPKYNIQFWNTLDAWINIHFEEMSYSFDTLSNEE